MTTPTPTPTPQNRNVLVPFFYFVFALGKAAFFRKIDEIDKNVQIYKNVPKTGFLVRAGRHFLKRMEQSQICRHKFVHENHIPLKISSGWYYKLAYNAMPHIADICTFTIFKSCMNGRNTKYATI